MPSRYGHERLRRLRNEIPLRRVLEALDWPHKMREGVLVFRCPVCGECRTSSHPRENLGRCFICLRNFNPIDLTLAIRRIDFVDAVEFLLPLLPPGSTTDSPPSKT